ncbi:hypothetical protein [Neorhizobium galegae]|uniref:Uncharacterized protein n=1 Tax=Neorhizobium galegae bv. officinalis TaxID=323656 RepID=A0A0T7GPC4_NEOGA|nr:hypothetical protein [Neorhizobium galegae]CDZ49145.1 Hypothetical protein NGAL_HAMBI1189_27860 [Neorhizobium galegae bv. officinalis]
MMVPEYPKRLARIGSVFALVGSLVWVQWPVDFEKFNIAAGIIFLASLVTWFSVELSDYLGDGSFADNVVSEDVEKFNSILGFVGPNQFYVIKNKAIQTYMEKDDYDGLRSLIHYSENDIFPFHNLKVQTSYEEFCKSAREFCSDFYSLYSSDGRGSATWRPTGDGYVSDEVFEKIMTKIAKLDRKASHLAELWEELIKLARHELKGASTKIRHYDTEGFR